MKKKRKGYAFRCQFNEKARIVSGCSGVFVHASSVVLLLMPTWPLIIVFDSTLDCFLN